MAAEPTLPCRFPLPHAHIIRSSAQAQPLLAGTLRSPLLQLLRPVTERLASQLDMRLLQTAVELLQVFLSHRQSALGLLLTELAG